jgi:hypothetical protein
VNNTDLLLGQLYKLRPTLAQLLSENSADIFNQPGRVPTTNDTKRTIQKALERGIVRVDSGGRPIRKVGQALDLASQELSANLRLELTPKGGALWERKAAPRWDYFLDEGEPRSARGNVWIFLTGTSRTWLQVIDDTLKALSFFRRTGRRFVVLHDWYPVYWKRFRVGYSLGIDTGHAVETQLGTRFMQGLAAGDERLASVFSVYSSIWDAKWVASLR